jgi:hypothetical protein
LNYLRRNAKSVQRQSIVEAFMAAFLIGSIAIVSVGIGICGAYCVVTAVLAALNPTQPARFIAAFVEHQTQGGD